MSLAELMPLVESLSQPDKERLFEYLGDCVALEDFSKFGSKIVIFGRGRSPDTG